ncbi:exopolysaccharide transport family protein [Crocinitomix catalasitica]|uniref:exopolysaccharide transport family protein n=1 Tax=Crocinitomix catalasitica TaxID=184607 RepID=UPI000486B83C|nr:exopolysaccharide transport family protein [Crocinitomix catalasitica]
MKELQRIKRLIIPLLKGLPIIIGCLIVSLLIARKAIQYSTPKYQSMSKIKLDDRKYGMSGNNLYEDFDVFSSENKIETEAEILKSPMLIGKTVDALRMDVLVARVGSIKTSCLYKDNPFIFEFEREGSNLLDKKFLIEVNQADFKVLNEEKESLTQGKIGQKFMLNGEEMTILLNADILAKKDLEINGLFSFEFKSRNKWISFINERLDVKAVDKEIPVIRVVITSEDAQLSADFATKLCEVYVDDYIYTKSVAATKTLSFIDERMSELQKVLSVSENKLEGYKKSHDVVNTLQETETGLRDISKLKLQLINLEMEEESIIELEGYISNGDYYEKTAINFGFGDLLLTELVKKLKLYTDEKRDLSMKYTENDMRLINVQEKIDDIEDYVKEAIVQNKRNIQTKKAEIESSIDEMSGQFAHIPTREKELRILERDFQINESVYTFLAQKKLEAQIASSALMSFHRIIQPATPATEPVSPNKVLITFVCGFLGLFGGILIVFGSKAVSGKIHNKVDIEKLTATPFAGIITKTKDLAVRKKDFIALATTFKMKQKGEKLTMTVTSAARNEGKSFFVENIAQTFQSMGYNVAILDVNPMNANFINDADFILQDLLQNGTAKFKAAPLIQNGIYTLAIDPQREDANLVLAHKKMDAVMDDIQSKFDIVLIDTPGSIISSEALSMLKYSKLCVYMMRTKVTNAEYVPNVDVIQEDFNFNAMQIVLNGAHKSTSFSGNFNGAQLHYREVPKGIWNKLKYYFATYAK